MYMYMYVPGDREDHIEDGVAGKDELEDVVYFGHLLSLRDSLGVFMYQLVLHYVCGLEWNGQSYRFGRHT